MTEELPEDVWARRDEKEVRDLIILAAWPMLTRVVGRLRQRLPAHVRVEEPDLRSYGLIGLYKALDSFDPHHGTPFDKFASAFVWGAVHDELRKLDWAPRSLRKRQREVEEKRRLFMATHDREPKDEELAQMLRWSTDDVATTRRQVDTAWPRSLDEIRGEAEKDLYAIIADADGDPEEHLIQAEESHENDRSTLINDQMSVYINDLPPQKRAVVTMTYYLQMKQSEVASVLGIPESRVSNIHLAFLEALHGELEKILTESA